MHLKFQIPYILMDHEKTKENLLARGASEKFIDDVLSILQTYPDNPIIRELLKSDIVNDISVLKC